MFFSQEALNKTSSNNSIEYNDSDYEDSDDDEEWETSKNSPVNKLSPLGQDEKKLDLFDESL